MLKIKFIVILILMALPKNCIVKADDEEKLSTEVWQFHDENELPIFDIRTDKMTNECNELDLPHDCASATNCTKRSGIYKIKIKYSSNAAFHVACDAETKKGDWLVIQRRQDGSQDFYRNWTEYEEGFGDIDGEFFLGLKKIHALTNLNGPQELLILLEHENGTKAYAKYDSFAISDNSESYKLTKIGKYSGTAGNSLALHINMKFTTKGNDNDLSKDSNCAEYRTGAWWYRNCYYSNLNGKYGDQNQGGIVWLSFGGSSTSLTYSKMMIRRSRRT